MIDLGDWPWWVILIEGIIALVLGVVCLRALKDLREIDGIVDRIDDIKTAFRRHYSTLHDCAWMDREKMLSALDETAEVVKNLLEDTEI